MENHSLKEKKSVISRYKNSFENPYKIVETAKRGLNASVFFDVSLITGISRGSLAKLLNSSLKTFVRYRRNRTKLNPSSSEFLLKILALFYKGKEVFGNTEHFKKWLDKPAYGLGGVRPVELMKTHTGVDLIYEELKRIEFGDLA